MTICAISDTHGRHMDATIPPCDLLIHAGDFTGGNLAFEVFLFTSWLSAQPAAHKVFIAGNHEILLDKTDAFDAELSNAGTGTTYLKNSGTTVNGLKIWGSPVQPRFMNWAFNVDRGPAIRKYWDMIPADIDILVTHGPPHGILDTISSGKAHLGCEELAIAVARIQPKLHIFGHIHGGYGTQVIGRTTYINAAFLDERYRATHKPVVIEV